MTDNSPSPEALAASLDYAAAGNLLHDQLARAFDEFARQAVELERAENEWLRRVLRWCRARLRHGSYVAWLDKYLAAGPSPAPGDEPKITAGTIS